MKLLDINLLLYATDREDVRHPTVAPWFDDVMNSGERVAMPWHTLLGFVRVSTQPRAGRDSRLTMKDALEFVSDWLEWDSVWIPEPTASHFHVVSELLRSAPRASLVSDAHLAALAIENGLVLCSTDLDFRLFKNLRLLNPLDAD
ncbi:MAG: PIN domain-containing protein [Cyanobacteria bacterium]|nr:PIN domain-containing protein [Cyanobacteriota bacterium]